MKHSSHEGPLFLALTFAAVLAFAACAAVAILVGQVAMPGIPVITPGVAHGAQAAMEVRR